MTEYNLWITVRYRIDSDEDSVIDEYVDGVEEALRDAALEPELGSVTFELEEADGD